MADDCRTVRFEDLIEEGLLEIGDGYRAKNNELGGDGPIFLRAGHVTDTHIDLDGVERFHAGLAATVQSKLSRPGDVVITTKGNSTGRTAWIDDALPPVVYSPHLSYWRSRDPNRLAPGFLRYWARSQEFATQLRGMQASTDMAPYLSLTDQRRLWITLPDSRSQRTIAHVLGTLDDKIELNRRTNETLEAMARALFKSWFVDFDPVRAKAAGKQPAGMDAETAALFPSEFVESEIGEIPKGWRVALIGEVGACIRDGVDPAAVPPDTPYIGLEHMPQRSIALGAWSHAAAAQSQKVRYKQGDILFGKLRPYFHKVGIAPNDGVCSTDIVVVRPHPDRLGLALGHLSSSEFIAFANAGSEGTRMPRTSWSRMSSYPIALPEASTSAALDRHVLPLVAEIRAGLFEAAQLATLRDTLLPRLLSGELRIPDAERIVGAAT